MPRDYNRPSSIHRENIIGRPEERILYERVAAAEPIHAILVRVSDVSPYDLHIAKCNLVRVPHLHHPGAAVRDSGNAFYLDIAGVVHYDDMPIWFVHTALVIIRILRAGVNAGAFSGDMKVMDLPEV